ncbi:MAG: hypothetical protein H6853_03755 [Rhodospirillales bacterium]|nr:hypothetical protein [Alphaproteobacteria bacterium]USO04395.1 MAG: hypothetical protein H6853_03755 [Rhodospirillales bacterium]
MKKEWDTKAKVNTDNRRGVLIDGDEVISEGTVNTTDADAPVSEKDQKTYGKDGKLKGPQKGQLPPGLKA